MVETKAIVFDLDDTLAPSKQPIPAEMAHELVLLARQFEVGILTGGQYRQVEQQVLAHLPKSVADRVHVFGCSGSQYSLSEGYVTNVVFPDASLEQLDTFG